MRESLRQSVRVRCNFRCGYCGVSETNIGAKMTIDHFLPRSLGGTNDLDNLVYCCHACNEFKGEYWQTEPELRLLQPLVDNSVEHYREQDNGTMIALTKRGANYIEVLHLNCPQLIAFRLEQQEIAATRALCRNLENLIAQLRQETAENKNTIGRMFGDPEV